MEPAAAASGANASAGGVGHSSSHTIAAGSNTAAQVGVGGFDHLAIDVSGYIGGAMRLLKIENAVGREHDISRVVSQHVVSTIRRFGPRKSVALFLDGPLPMWRVAKYRAQSSASKRGESRLLRAPAGPLVESVEERVLEAVLDDGRAFMPSQIVFSSSCEAGSAEQKMGAWGFYHATREACERRAHNARVGSTPSNYIASLTSLYGEGVDGDDDSAPANVDVVSDDYVPDSLGFVGATELYMMVLAAPHGNATSLVQSNAEYKGVRTATLRDWLHVDDAYATRGQSLSHGAMSADDAFRRCAEVLLLMLIANGHSSSDLAAVQSGAGLSELLLAHVKEFHSVAAEDRLLHALVSSDVKRQRPLYLRLNLQALLRILKESAGPSAKWAAATPAFDAGAQSYLVVLLETVSMLCYGVVHDALYTRSELVAGTKPHTLSTPVSRGAASALPPTAKSLLGHLLFVVDVCKQQWMAPAETASQPLTAAEYATLIAGTQLGVREAIERFTKLTVADDIAASICDEPHTAKALDQVRQVFCFSNPRNVHRALSPAPTFFLSPAVAASPSGSKTTANSSAWKAWPVDVAGSTMAMSLE